MPSLPGLFGPVVPDFGIRVLLALTGVALRDCKLGPAARVDVALPGAHAVARMLVLATEREGADRAGLVAHAQDRGVPDCCVPRTIFCTKKLPLLGTGKTDYPAMRVLAEDVRMPAEVTGAKGPKPHQSRRFAGRAVHGITVSTATPPAPKPVRLRVLCALDRL